MHRMKKTNVSLGTRLRTGVAFLLLAKRNPRSVEKEWKNTSNNG